MTTPEVFPETKLLDERILDKVLVMTKETESLDFKAEEQKDKRRGVWRRFKDISGEIRQSLEDEGLEEERIKNYLDVFGSSVGNGEEIDRLRQEFFDEDIAEAAVPLQEALELLMPESEIKEKKAVLELIQALENDIIRHTQKWGWSDEAVANYILALEQSLGVTRIEELERAMEGEEGANEAEVVAEVINRLTEGAKFEEIGDLGSDVFKEVWQILLKNPNLIKDHLTDENYLLWLQRAYEEGMEDEFREAIRGYKGAMFDLTKEEASRAESGEKAEEIGHEYNKKLAEFGRWLGKMRAEGKITGEFFKELEEEGSVDEAITNEAKKSYEEAMAKKENGKEKAKESVAKVEEEEASRWLKWGQTLAGGLSKGIQFMWNRLTPQERDALGWAIYGLGVATGGTLTFALNKIFLPGTGFLLGTAKGQIRSAAISTTGMALAGAVTSYLLERNYTSKTQGLAEEEIKKLKEEAGLKKSRYAQNFVNGATAGIALVTILDFTGHLGALDELAREKLGLSITKEAGQRADLLEGYKDVGRRAVQGALEKGTEGQFVDTEEIISDALKAKEVGRQFVDTEEIIAEALRTRAEKGVNVLFERRFDMGEAPNVYRALLDHIKPEDFPDWTGPWDNTHEESVTMAIIKWARENGKLDDIANGGKTLKEILGDDGVAAVSPYIEMPNNREAIIAISKAFHAALGIK